MPTGSGYAHLSHVRAQSDRLRVGVGVVHSPDVPYTPEDAQPPQPSVGPRVSFATSGSENVSGQEPEDAEELNRDSIGEVPVVDKTFIRLMNYVYDQYVLLLILWHLHVVNLRIISWWQSLNRLCSRNYVFILV